MYHVYNKGWTKEYVNCTEEELDKEKAHATIKNCGVARSADTTVVEVCTCCDNVIKPKVTRKLTFKERLLGYITI